MEHSDRQQPWNSLKSDSNAHDLNSIKVENALNTPDPYAEDPDLVDLIFNRRKKPRDPYKEEKACDEKKVDKKKVEKGLGKPRNPQKQIQSAEQPKQTDVVKLNPATEGRGTFYKVQTRHAAELTTKFTPNADKIEKAEAEEEDPPIKVENTLEVQLQYKKIYLEELEKYKPHLEKQKLPKKQKKKK